MMMIMKVKKKKASQNLLIDIYHILYISIQYIVHATQSSSFTEHTYTD